MGEWKRWQEADKWAWDETKRQHWADTLWRNQQKRRLGHETLRRNIAAAEAKQRLEVQLLLSDMHVYPHVCVHPLLPGCLRSCLAISSRACTRPSPGLLMHLAFALLRRTHLDNGLQARHHVSPKHSISISSRCRLKRRRGGGSGGVSQPGNGAGTRSMTANLEARAMAGGAKTSWATTPCWGWMLKRA